MAGSLYLMSIIENALAGVRWPECFIWLNVRLNQRYINVNIPVTAFAIFPLDLNEYWHALHGLHIPVYNYNYNYIFIRRFSSHAKVNSIVCVFVIPPTNIVLKWSIRQSLLLTRSAHVTRPESIITHLAQWYSHWRNNVYGQYSTITMAIKVLLKILN